VKRSASLTPVRQALRGDSPLQDHVEDGLGAVEAAHRAYLDESIRSAFADSLDADDSLRQGHEGENRWDYLLGLSSSNTVVAVEPHSAKDDQIGTVIRKKRAALIQLRDHLRDGARIAKWLWVASGTVQFARTEGATARLNQEGIEFAGRRIMAKHLPLASRPAKTKKRRKVRS
jgi:hypothetical protein